MKHANLKALRRRLFIKYACIIIGITLGTITLIYLFDDVLNGVVIDFIRLFMETGDPFAMFRKIYMIVLPLLIVAAIILMIYFLCRDLVNYMRILMRGMEKKDLIYLLAQDIKMPLSNILMYLEFLHKETRISPEIQKDFVIQVLHKSLDLEDMINEFFDITRFNLQYAKWNPEHMYLDRMMEQVVDEYYMLMEAKQMEVSIESGSGLALFADNEKIARVMRDLLRNLVELGRVKATIHIRMQEFDERYEVLMEVESRHLSAYQIAHIFHNYYRLEDVHGEGNLHVLGLGIARQIMDMQKGTLRASSIDKLLSFTVQIPKAFVPGHKESVV